MSRKSREEHLNYFNEVVREIEYLKCTLNATLYWDNLVCMPKDSIIYRSKVMGFLANEQHKRIHNKDFMETLKYLEATKTKNNPKLNGTIAQLKRTLNYINLIPEKVYQEYRSLLAISESEWSVAKTENSYKRISPYLKKIFEYYSVFAECWGYEDEPYDALLGYYEDGLTTKKLDYSLEKIKPFLLDSLNKINEVSLSKDYTRISGISFVSKEEQLELSKFLLGLMGFDFNKGRVDIGSYPTILSAGPNDVRIINDYKTDNLLYGIYNILHSAGKGIYQQNIDNSLTGTLLAEPPSFVIEEAIGRLYENIIGRSKGFSKFIDEQMKTRFSHIKGITAEDLYFAVNKVSTSNDRVEADEIGSLLHILVRYEIEKDLINKNISIEDLPDIWKSKYKNYLGLDIESEDKSLLQDIHWSAGYIGYFPTYFLGNMMAAQIGNSIESTLGSTEAIIEKGDFNVIKNWLSQKIFSDGATKSSNELLIQATGEGISAEYLIKHLRTKYSEVYKINL